MILMAIRGESKMFKIYKKKPANETIVQALPTQTEPWLGVQLARLWEVVWVVLLATRSQEGLVCLAYN